MCTTNMAPVGLCSFADRSSAIRCKFHLEIISETLDIMPEKEIEDELFKVRGQISGDTLAQLHIRGANTNVTIEL